MLALMVMVTMKEEKMNVEGWEEEEDVVVRVRVMVTATVPVFYLVLMEGELPLCVAQLFLLVFFRPLKFFSSAACRRSEHAFFPYRKYVTPSHSRANTGLGLQPAITSTTIFCCHYTCKSVSKWSLLLT
ncbi:hypothetical protein BJY00DRAFT_117157 [Aspergillus carlsbadensis]|nr:hypothetical protein BJY00DRAFT_117157 [Aspergillus carlsbadensis]